jgi:alpha-N-arabinofuranosidase
VQAKNRSPKKVNISFDEFNTWHTIVEEQRFEEKWRTAPPLLEDVYTMEDVLVLGGMLLSVLRHADRVEIACLSELVNCISHIRTRNGGGAWVMPPYYAFLHFSQYGRGTALHTAVDSPLYDSKEFTDAPYLDAQAVQHDDGSIAVFAINRSAEEAMPFETELRGFEGYTVKQHIVVSSDDPKDTNTENDPAHVQPKTAGNAVFEDGLVKAELEKLSWNVILLEKKRK